MFWKITSFPPCDNHVFLSHCAEDRSNLIHPVYEELRRRGITPWLDRDHYLYGRDSRAGLRDGLLRCRHAVFFVTKGMMAHRRGWCHMELAYGDLLQANLLFRGGPLLNFALPLFFLDQNDPELARTTWNLFRDRGEFHHPSKGDWVPWTVDRIAAFLQREQKLALEMAWQLSHDKQMHKELDKIPGIVQRVTQFDPRPIA